MTLFPRDQNPRGAAIVIWLALAVASCGASKVQPPAAGKPLRVLPTNATAVDFVFDLIDPERVIAVPDTVKDYATVDVDFAQWTGDRTFNEFSAEVLLSFDPDLVVVSPWQDQNTINRLLESGIKVVELPPVNELDDIREALTMISEALGESEKGAKLLVEFDKRAKALAEAAAMRGTVGGIIYTNYGSGGWAAGRGTTAHQLLMLAGVSNVVAEAGWVGHDGVDIERLLDFNPDVLIISKPSRDYGVTRKFLDNEEALQDMDAIRENRIVELPAGLFSTASHHLLDAAELLAGKIDAMVKAGRVTPRAR
jgi:iron complex transport system substrate-binding protein